MCYVQFVVVNLKEILFKWRNIIIILLLITGMYYTPPRPIPMTNIQQASQNPPVANMSNAQNSHGPSLIVQSQPIEMTTNAQPLQVPQQPASAPMQPSEPRPRRKNAAIKIINPQTGAEVVLTENLFGLLPPVRYYLWFNLYSLNMYKLNKNMYVHIQ